MTTHIPLHKASELTNFVARSIDPTTPWADRVGDLRDRASPMPDPGRAQARDRRRQWVRDRWRSRAPCTLRPHHRQSRARFRQTGPRAGSFDAGFGTAYLARLVGQMQAREIRYLCRQYSAEQAYEWGLVNAVVEPGRVAPSYPEHWFQSEFDRLLIRTRNVAGGVAGSGPAIQGRLGNA